MKGEVLMEIDGWALIDPKNIDDEKKRLVDGQKFASFMWHACEALKFEYRDEEDENIECEIRYLDAEDSVVGKCWYCQEAAPRDLHTVWTIHNMDIIRDIPDPHEDSWSGVCLKRRIADIDEHKKHARELGWYHG
jgi:hypothetical protein